MFGQRDEIQEKRLQHQLEMQSMQIEHVFDRHQVDAQVEGGTVKPRLISFNLQTQLATGLERLKMLTDDLMHTLGVPVSLSREDGQFRLHVSQPEVPPVSLLDLMSLLTELPPITAVLGLAEDGRPVLLDFSEQDMTHILVSGVSGAGKTALLRSLVMSLALMNRQSRVQFVILDGESRFTGDETTLLPLNYLPHMLASVIDNPNDIRDTMAFMMNEVSYRLEYEVISPTILVVVDEVVALLELGEPLVKDAIRFLAQRGADVGVHLVMSTEKPQSAVLDALLKANISVQIVGRLADRDQAVTVTGLQGTQADYLLGQGDFLAVAGQFMTHFQAAYIGDYDLHMTLQELHRNRPPALLAQSVDMAQPISLSGLEMDEGVIDIPQHFVLRGDAVSLQRDEIKKVSLAVELDKIPNEEYMPDEIYSVPQPVIRLLHDIEGTTDEEFVEGKDDDLETADSSFFGHTDDLSSLLSADKIYHALSTAKRKPIYGFQLEKQTVNLKLIESLRVDQPELTVPAEQESGNEASDNNIDAADDAAEFEEDRPELLDAEIVGKTEAEYEAFQDDWLPFDDE